MNADRGAEQQREMAGAAPVSMTPAGRMRAAIEQTADLTMG
jgi:hypothetical protein